MKTKQEFIQETIVQAVPQSTPEERKKCEDFINRFLADDVDLTEAMGISPEVQEVLYAYAHRLYESGKYTQAFNAFSLLAIIDSTNPTYFFGMGACQHLLKNYKDALFSYKTSFYLDVTNPLPLYHASDCCIHLNMFEEAIIFLGMVIVQAGEDEKYASIKERARMTQEALFNSHKTSDTNAKPKDAKETSVG